MQVLIVYSEDEDLKFLEPLVAKLLILYSTETVEIKRLSTSIQSHEDAINSIRDSEQDSLIIFICHGGSSYILGHKNVEGLSVDDEHFELLSAKNISIIEGKSLICLSCNSRDGLGNLVINNNGRALIGFGNIEFDDPRREGKISEKVERIAQNLMINVLSKTFEYVSKRKSSFQEFVNYFKLFTNKECDEQMKEKSDIIIRACNFLWHLKDEITLFGDKESILFDNKKG